MTSFEKTIRASKIAEDEGAIEDDRSHNYGDGESRPLYWFEQEN